MFRLLFFTIYFCSFFGTNAVLAQDSRAVGLDELIQRALDNDLDIMSLRSKAQVAAAEVGIAHPFKNPEVRLGYSHRSSAALPQFTERITENISEQGRRNNSFAQNGTFNGTTQRNQNYIEVNGASSRTTATSLSPDGNSVTFDRSGSSSFGNFTENSGSAFGGVQSGNQSSTETFSNNRVVTTTREINGRSTRETTTERTVENFSEDRASSSTSSTGGEFGENRTGSSSQTETTSRARNGALSSETDRSFNSESRDRNGNFSELETGSEAERRVGQSDETITSETIREEEVFGDDPNAPIDSFSGEIRLYPRNPWEMRAHTGRAMAEVSMAEFMVEARAREVIEDVRSHYREIQIGRMKRALKEYHLEQAETDLDAFELRAAQQVKRLTDLTKHRLKIIKLEGEITRHTGTIERDFRYLAQLAGLSFDETIDFDDDVESRWLELGGLQLDTLADIAFTRNADLGRLIHQSELVKRNVEIDKAQRIPWFSLLAASYDYDERWDAKYRDEWGLTVGIEIPLFAWLNKKDKVNKLAHDTLLRQAETIRANVRRRIEASLVQLEGAANNVSGFRAKGDQMRMKAQNSLRSLPANHPQVIEITQAYETILLDLDNTELDYYTDYIRALLAFESVMGTDLEDLFIAMPTVNPGQTGMLTGHGRSQATSSLGSAPVVPAVQVVPKQQFTPDGFPLARTFPVPVGSTTPNTQSLQSSETWQPIHQSTQIQPHAAPTSYTTPVPYTAPAPAPYTAAAPTPYVAPASALLAIPNAPTIITDPIPAVPALPNLAPRYPGTSVLPGASTLPSAPVLPVIPPAPPVLP